MDWQPKKRLIQKSSAPSKPRRSPSHVKTQAKDPGFKRIQAICTRAKDGLSEDNVVERVLSFNKQLTEFAECAGAEMLERMDAHKKLAEMVAQEFKFAGRSFCSARGPSDCMTHAYSLFPLDGKRRATELDIETLKEMKRQSIERSAAAASRLAVESGGHAVEWDDF